MKSYLWLLIVLCFGLLFYLSRNDQIECNKKKCPTENMEHFVYQGRCYCVLEVK